MSKEDDTGLPEQDPNELVHAEAGNATVTDCENKAGAENQDTALVSFREELQDAYQPEPEIMVPSPDDGLPVPANELVEPMIAPPFTVDHVVCIEDERTWVEVFLQEWHERGGFTRGTTRNDDFFLLISQQYAEDGREVERRTFAPDQVERLFGMPFVKTFQGYIPVRPIRERCEHYNRQVISNDGVPDPTEIGHQIMFRNCAARRSVGGAFLSLRDEAVYACDYRSPYDHASAEKYMNGPDRDRLKNEAHKTRLPLFRKA